MAVTASGLLPAQLSLHLLAMVLMLCLALLGVCRGTDLIITASDSANIFVLHALLFNKHAHRKRMSAAGWSVHGLFGCE